MSDSEIDDIKARLVRLEEKPAQRHVPWKKIGIGVGALLALFMLIGILSPPETYSDMANREAARCVDSGDDGQWNPGVGNLQTVCQIKGDAKALQAKALADAQDK